MAAVTNNQMTLDVMRAEFTDNHGEMEGWKSGRLEERKGGRVEEWVGSVEANIDSCREEETDQLRQELNRS